MKNPKAKGSAFERKVAEQLSLWITSGKCKDCFWRSAISGGRATVAKKKGNEVRQSGDICAVAPEGFALCNLFFIECKHLSRCDVDAALGDKGDLLRIWRKLKRQASDHDKFPVLILKQNHRPTLWISAHSTPLSALEPRATLYAHNMDIYFFEEDILDTDIPDCLTRARQ